MRKPLYLKNDPRLLETLSDASGVSAGVIRENAYKLFQLLMELSEKKAGG